MKLNTNFILVMLILLLFLLASGCASKPIEVQFQDNNVIVPEAPPKAPLSEPVQLRELAESDKGDFDKISKISILNIRTLRTRIEKLETILEGYR